MSEFLATLENLSWRLVPPAKDTELPVRVIARYGALPAQLVVFISSSTSCINPTEEAWFVSASDLSRDDPFRFNEYELMSLEAADSDAQLAAIRAFWQTHFPLFFALPAHISTLRFPLRALRRAALCMATSPSLRSALSLRCRWTSSWAHFSRHCSLLRHPTPSAWRSRKAPPNRCCAP